MKICTKCKEEKDLSEFCEYKTRKDGYNYNCKKCENERNKKYRENNKEKGIKKWKLYYKNNTEKKLAYNKKYKIDNKEQVKIQINNNVNFKCKTDIQFKLSKNLRTRLCNSIRTNQKIGSAISDLGCSIQHLKLHLELFWDEGMSWDNYGKEIGQWSIDHIKPLSKFDLTDRLQLLEAVSYKNLQPLWHMDNLLKYNKDAE